MGKERIDYDDDDENDDEPEEDGEEQDMNEEGITYRACCAF